MGQHKDKLQQLTAALRAAESRIAMALPPRAVDQWTPQRVIAVAAMAAYRDPALLECDRASVVAAVIAAATLGLEPGGPLGEAALIPRRLKSGQMVCQLMVTYRGLLVLAYRAGGLKAAYAHVVYRNDQFSLEYGTEPRVVHVPALTADRGDPVGAYAVAELISGARDVEWMSRAEIEAVRKRSQTPDRGPWATDWGEMARKTVLRRLLKRLPLSGDLLSRAIEHDNALYEQPPGTPEVQFEDRFELPAGEQAAHVETVDGNNKSQEA